MADYLDDALDELDRLRAENAALLQRALAALNQAPDVDPARATRAEVAALHGANLAAWIVLTEGDVPPSRRDARFAPVHEQEMPHGC